MSLILDNLEGHKESLALKTGSSLADGSHRSEELNHFSGVQCGMHLYVLWCTLQIIVCCEDT